jgi:hypothetical protein
MEIKNRGAKRRETQDFSESVKDDILDKKDHKCAVRGC